MVENKLSDTIYELRVSDYAVANEVGTSETHDYGTGSISTINYVDVPGFTAGVSGYYLYCPGTKKNEIDERALTSITDYYIEQIFEGEELTSYILYDKDSGNDYTWRISW